MRLDHLLSKEEEVRVLYTVEFSRMTIKDWNPGNERFPVSMRLGDTPVPIPNTMVKTDAADNTWLETAREDRWLPDL